MSIERSIASLSIVFLILAIVAFKADAAPKDSLASCEYVRGDGDEFVSASAANKKSRCSLVSEADPANQTLTISDGKTTKTIKMNVITKYGAYAAMTINGAPAWRYEIDRTHFVAATNDLAIQLEWASQ
jgi:hypothetical protein